MVPQGKSQRYVSNRRGWRGGKRSLAHQADCIIESMQAHGRDLSFYEPIPDDLRAVIEEKLSASQPAKKASPVDDEMLATIAAHIVRATIRKGGDPKLAIEPYSNTVRKLVAQQLTYSECKAAGLISPKAKDSVEQCLRSSAKKIERQRYVAIGAVAAA